MCVCYMCTFNHAPPPPFQVGLLGIDAVAWAGYGTPGAPPGVFLPPSPWSWIDPGAFALVGAGAFMGGVTRLTVSVAVIMMEVSNDVRMLIPILVAVLVAKWVADAVAHPLYHAGNGEGVCVLVVLGLCRGECVFGECM